MLALHSMQSYIHEWIKKKTSNNYPAYSYNSYMYLHFVPDLIKVQPSSLDDYYITTAQSPPLFLAFHGACIWLYYSNNLSSIFYLLRSMYCYIEKECSVQDDPHICTRRKCRFLFFLSENLSLLFSASPLLTSTSFF